MIRTYKLKQLANNEKQLKIISVINEYRKTSLTISKFQRKNEGLLEGRAEVKAQVIEYGDLKKTQNYAIKLLNRKFNKITKKVENLILECNDISKLDKIPNIIFDVSSLKDIENIFIYLKIVNAD
jgi:hypothetical protein